MNKEQLNLTIEELEELCGLYLDCKLTVLQEKELEYILSCSTPDSPTISEVRGLMQIQLLPEPRRTVRKSPFRNWKVFSGIAASIAVIICAAVYVASPGNSSLPESDSNVYITAYSHGVRLEGAEAVQATNSAMSKAEALMNMAASTEQEFMLRAEDIINRSLNN